MLQDLRKVFFLFLHFWKNKTEFEFRFLNKTLNNELKENMGKTNSMHQSTLN